MRFEKCWQCRTEKPPNACRYHNTDIFGHTITTSTRGRDAEWHRGPFDLSESEGAVWAEFGHDTKHVVGELLRLRAL